MHSLYLLRASGQGRGWGRGRGVIALQDLKIVGHLQGECFTWLLCVAWPSHNLVKLHTVDLDKLVGFLRKQCDLWRSLGRALKLPEEEVEGFGSHCSSDFDCLVEVCDAWLKHQRDEDAVPSWLTIVTALEQINAQHLAEEIRKAVYSKCKVHAPIEWSLCQQYLHFHCVWDSHTSWPVLGLLLFFLFRYYGSQKHAHICTPRRLEL